MAFAIGDDFALVFDGRGSGRFGVKRRATEMAALRSLSVAARAIFMEEGFAVRFDMLHT